MSCTLLSVELSFVLRRLQAEVYAVSLHLSEASEPSAVPPGPGELLVLPPQEAPVAGEPSTAECSVHALTRSQLTLLRMETLSWHRHTELVGNQFICLNLQPSLSSVYLETLYFLQYSSFIFSSVPCVTCSKLKLGHHRHIFIHPTVLIHITPPTLAESLALIHTQRKWISYCTQESVSHHIVHDWTVCVFLPQSSFLTSPVLTL